MYLHNIEHWVFYNQNYRRFFQEKIFAVISSFVMLSYDRLSEWTLTVLHFYQTLSTKRPQSIESLITKMHLQK